MKTLTTSHVLDALNAVANALDSRPAAMRGATRAHDAAPDIDELEESELLVRTLAEAIDSIASDPDLPHRPFEDPLAAPHPELDTEQVPAARA